MLSVQVILHCVYFHDNNYRGHCTYRTVPPITGTLCSIEWSYHVKVVTFKSLKVELEVEVGLVKLMNSNITILTSASITPAVRVELDGVNRTEMSLDTTKLLFEEQMEESSIELPNPCASSCDIHSFLSTTQNYMVK